MKRMNRATLLLLPLFFIAACSEPTRYVPASSKDGAGYSTTAVERNRYRVAFRGNSLTSRETVENYMLYRAAEVTVAAGGDWFRLTDRDTETVTRYQSTGTGFDSFGVGFYGYPYQRVGVSASTSISSSRRYEASAEVLVYRGRKPRAEPEAYDARSVLATLGKTIERQ